MGGEAGVGTGLGGVEVVGETGGTCFGLPCRATPRDETQRRRGGCRNCFSWGWRSRPQAWPQRSSVIAAQGVMPAALHSSRHDPIRHLSSGGWNAPRASGGEPGRFEARRPGYTPNKISSPLCVFASHPGVLSGTGGRKGAPDASQTTSTPPKSVPIPAPIPARHPTPASRHRPLHGSIRQRLGQTPGMEALEEIEPIPMPLELLRGSEQQRL